MKQSTSQIILESSLASRVWSGALNVGIKHQKVLPRPFLIECTIDLSPINRSTIIHDLGIPMRRQLTLNKLVSRIPSSCSTGTPLLLLPRHLLKLMKVSDTLLHILPTTFHINWRHVVFGIFVMIEIHNVGLVEVLVDVYDVTSVSRYVSHSMWAICNRWLFEVAYQSSTINLIRKFLLIYDNILLLLFLILLRIEICSLLLLLLLSHFLSAIAITVPIVIRKILLSNLFSTSVVTAHQTLIWSWWWGIDHLLSGLQEISTVDGYFFSRVGGLCSLDPLFLDIGCVSCW